MTLFGEGILPMKRLGQRRDEVAMRVYGNPYKQLCSLRQDAVNSTLSREDRLESTAGG